MQALTRGGFFAALIAAILSPFHLLAELRKPHGQFSSPQAGPQPKFFWLESRSDYAWPGSTGGQTHVTFNARGLRSDGKTFVEAALVRVGCTWDEAQKIQDEAWRRLGEHLLE